MNGMEGMDGMMGAGFMIGFMILGLIFLVAIIALVVWLLMRLFPNLRGAERQETRGDSAEQILQERFARGEIDAEEYEHSLEVRRGKSGAESQTTDER
jgi:putative membrane protein